MAAWHNGGSPGYGQGYAGYPNDQWGWGPVGNQGPWNQGRWMGTPQSWGGNQGYPYPGWGSNVGYGYAPQPPYYGAANAGFASPGFGYGTAYGYGLTGGYGYGAGGGPYGPGIGNYGQGFGGYGAWPGNYGPGYPNYPWEGYEGQFTGIGPRGYRRSDQRIEEDVCDELWADSHMDAHDVSAKVNDGVVTLSGTVPSRDMRRRAEDDANSVIGVSEVCNDLQVAAHEHDEHGEMRGEPTAGGQPYARESRRS